MNKLQSTFIGSTLALSLMASSAAYAGNEHGQQPTGGTPPAGDTYNNPSVEQEFSFSPSVESELNNWVKNSNYNAGNNVSIEGLSPEARAEVKNWTSAVANGGAGGKGGAGGNVEQEFGDGAFSPNSMSSLEAELSQQQQQGQGQEQGQGQDQGQSQINEGNNMSYTNNSRFKSGAITGAPALGSLFVPDSCMDGLQFTIGGGLPYSGSGGLGFSFINPAGVALKDGLTILEFLDKKEAERGHYMEGLSGGEKERLNCISNVADAQREAQAHATAMQTGQYNHLERMQDAQFEQQAIMKQLEVAGEAYLRFVEHVCGHTAWKPSIAEHRDQCDRVYEDSSAPFTFKTGQERFNVPTAIVVPAPVRIEEDAPAAPGIN